MSTLSLLPLIKVTDGVQTDEDWQLAIAFYLDDGITPINLLGLSFILSVGGISTITSLSGQVAITGPSNNLLVVTVLSSQKAAWATGIYPISLTANDGTHVRDIFALSTLAVGSPQTARVSLIVAPDTVPRSVASPVSSALATAFQALQPSAIAVALGSLTNSELSSLAQAILGSLDLQSGSTAPVPSGQAFINSSGYVVFAQ